VTAPLSRRSLLAGGVTIMAGGIAGYVVTRSTDAAKANPGTVTPNGYAVPAPHSTASPRSPGTLLTPLSDVPQGGGVVIGSQHIVVTRDSSGAVHAFSAVCTHQGCLVNQVSNGTIDCPCHGSQFNADTGAVVTGPASTPLPQVSTTVKGGNVYRT
jgi:Rieske Fe-S protein